MPKNDRSKNALKHGAFSRELILPGERRKDYERLLAELEAEYSPSGPSEICLVNHLASLLWRERRLQVYRRAKLENRVRTIERKNKSSHWMGVLNSLAPLLAAATTAKEVEAILASENLTPAAITFKFPQPPPDQEAKWGPAIAEYFNKMKISEQLHGIDAFAQALDPVEMECELLQANRLHEEIDKTIKRLAQVKAYKQLGLVARVDVNTLKLIEAPNKAIASARQHNNENSPELANEVAKVTKRKDQNSNS
jgi:hypothetical protein